MLKAHGAVVVEGPKACGKTETARRQAGSEVLLDVDENARMAAALEPSAVLAGERPRLIDEWQVEPRIWNHVRRSVDDIDDSRPGQFILTGSAIPPEDETRHTGAGRFGRIRMRPMTLAETGTSNRSISLAGLMSGSPSVGPDNGIALADLIEEVLRGGWPGLRHLELAAAMRAVRDYLEQIRRADISRVDGVRRDPARVLAVLQSVARNVGTQVKLTSIARDASGANTAVRDDTVSSYLSALERLMIVEDQPAWNVHLRSSHRLRTTPTRHFVDPSLAAAALRATPSKLLADLNTLGLMFESLVVRDLRVYAQASDAEVFHYRDHKDLEVDAIVVSDAGPWAAFEVKLGIGQVDEAAANLLRFVERVDTSRIGPPAGLGVVVGTGYGYVRADGVHVVPVGALAP